MKIVFLSPTFSPKMSGYAGMALPKAMAQLNVDVHVVAGNLNVYFNDPNYQATYHDLLGPAVTPCGVQEVNGFVLHRLPHQKIGSHVRLKGLYGTLRKLRPQILQTWTVISLIPLEAAIWSSILGYKLFTAQHTCASVFPAATKKKLEVGAWLKNFILRSAHGRIIAARTAKCYPATPDCQEIAVRFMGVPNTKCTMRPLGVDTELFHSITSLKHEKERLQMRDEFGFRETDIVCLYSGRFTRDKNPLCLARAVHELRRHGRPFCAFFIGDGLQKHDIVNCRGSVVHDFVNYSDLPAYYRMADIGVWPTQESTSMLDAAAIGLPIVVSDRIQARERVDGNGLTYAENNIEDLTATLKLLEDSGERLRLGQAGAAKMKSQFSWLAIAHRTLRDFERALQHK